MKKMVGLLLKITFLGCTKEDDTPKKFDLNGTFVATVAGWSQPLPINDLATWVATYIDDRITANITYYLGSPGRAKYKGKIVNDTTLIGVLLTFLLPVLSMKKLVKTAIELLVQLLLPTLLINYFRVSFNLLRK